MATLRRLSRLTGLTTLVVLAATAVPAAADGPVEDPPYYVCTDSPEPVGYNCIVIG